MCFRNCWVTALEVKERMSQFKKETNGKESYEPEAWPFPKSKPQEIKILQEAKLLSKMKAKK